MEALSALAIDSAFAETIICSEKSLTPDFHYM
jgi:hypothetical protein